MKFAIKWTCEDKTAKGSAILYATPNPSLLNQIPWLNSFTGDEQFQIVPSI